MIFLGKGKAKLRKTGEAVYVVDYNGEGDKRRKTDWVSYIDSKGVEHEMEKGLNPQWDFVEWRVPSDYEIERNAEHHLCIFAGMIAQGLISNIDQNSKYVEERIAEAVKTSVKYAKELCIEVSKIDVVSFSKLCLEQEKKQETAEQKTDYSQKPISEVFDEIERLCLKDKEEKQRLQPNCVIQKEGLARRFLNVCYFNDIENVEQLLKFGWLKFEKQRNSGRRTVEYVSQALTNLYGINW